MTDVKPPRNAHGWGTDTSSVENLNRYRFILAGTFVFLGLVGTCAWVAFLGWWVVGLVL